MPATLEGNALDGVELSEDDGAGLPPEHGLYYFRLNQASPRLFVPPVEKSKPKEERTTPTVERDASAVLEWRHSEFDLSDASFTLYMTVP